MQTSKMYSIHDAAAGAYLAPFFMQNDLLAIRAFAALVNDATHIFSQEPKDFTLFCFGEFDISTGAMELETKPRPVRSGIVLVKRDPNPAQKALPLEDN
jgi:hypothetical protein